MNHSVSQFERNNSRADTLYLILVTLFSVLLTICNMIGIKLFKAPVFTSFALTSGIIAYPLTFLITDVVSEIWGAKKAKLMIFIGFGMNLVMLLFVQIILRLPSHSDWAVPNNPFGYTDADMYQNAFASIFSINDKILMGSMIAYLIAQLIDIRVFCFCKYLTKGRHLWLRNNASTLISQFIDTIIVSTFVLFWGLKLSFTVGCQIMVAEYCYKTIFALCDTPFVYICTYSIKRYCFQNEFQKAA